MATEETKKLPVLRYVVTFINSSPTGQEKVHLTHDSLAETRSWASRNNYVIGTPRLHTATFSIEHTDGSPPSKEEYLYLQPEDSITLFENRQQDAFDNIRNGDMAQTTGLYDGAVNVVMRNLPQKI